MTGAKIIGIKICGLTTPKMAEDCVTLGADAIGCVFFPPSPRNVSLDQAREICAAVAGKAETVGVFVNAPADEIIKTIDHCGLDGAQLHGTETPETVDQLNQHGIMVIKSLFAAKAPGFDEAGKYPSAAVLVECGQGRLPGGNARTWNWADAAAIGRKNPLVLAGGLSPDNIGEAIQAARPDAVDVSSGVEISPGKKDMEKVRAFINTVRALNTDKIYNRLLRRIF